MLGDVVDKVNITKKMNDTNYQQSRIVIKYRYIGVMTGVYKPRSMETLERESGFNMTKYCVVKQYFGFARSLTG